MALSFEQLPVNTAVKVPVITNWTPVIGYMLYTNDAVDTYYYHKLILEVRLDSSTGTVLGKIKQRRNGYSVDVSNDDARAFFDLRDIVNTQLVDTVYDQNLTGAPFSTVHKVGANSTARIYSVSGNKQQDRSQVVKIYVKGYQEYSLSQNASPTENATGAQNSTLYYMQATLPLTTPRFVTSGGVDATYIQGNSFEGYTISDTGAKFLSDLTHTDYNNGAVQLRGYMNFITENDYHTLAFLNNNADFDSDLVSILIQYYDSGGSIIGTNQIIPNTSGNGGANPSSEANTTPEYLIYFGCGPANLEASTVTPTSGSAGDAAPSNFANWAYYRVVGVNSSAAQTTDNYYFIKTDSNCKGYKARRLAWRNSLGCYDYYNFNMKSSQKVEVKRDSYGQMLGVFNKSKYRYDEGGRGQSVMKTTAVLKETLQTDWVRETDAHLFEKLLLSTNVEIIENADTIKYTIKIEYANPLNTNS